MKPRSRRTSFLETIQSQRIIAAVKEPILAERAGHAGVRVLFHLVGTLYDVAETLRRRPPGTMVFCHVDLLQGLAKDAVGMRILARELRVDGILTTRRHLIRAAQEEGLMAILRLFLLDSDGLHTALEVAKKTEPDAIEILPAMVVPHLAHRIPFSTLPPAICGGFVERPEQLEWVLQAPVLAVSTSAEALWTWRPGATGAAAGRAGAPVDAEETTQAPDAFDPEEG